MGGGLYRSSVGASGYGGGGGVAAAGTGGDAANEVSDQQVKLPQKSASTGQLAEAADQTKANFEAMRYSSVTPPLDLNGDQRKEFKPGGISSIQDQKLISMSFADGSDVSFAALIDSHKEEAKNYNKNLSNQLSNASEGVRYLHTMDNFIQNRQGLMLAVRSQEEAETFTKSINAWIKTAQAAGAYGSFKLEELGVKTSEAGAGSSPAKGGNIKQWRLSWRSSEGWQDEFIPITVIIPDTVGAAQSGSTQELAANTLFEQAASKHRDEMCLAYRDSFQNPFLVSTLEDDSPLSAKNMVGYYKYWLREEKSKARPSTSRLSSEATGEPSSGSVAPTPPDLSSGSTVPLQSNLTGKHQSAGHTGSNSASVIADPSATAPQTHQDSGQIFTRHRTTQSNPPEVKPPAAAVSNQPSLELEKPPEGRFPINVGLSNIGGRSCYANAALKFMISSSGQDLLNYLEESNNKRGNAVEFIKRLKASYKNVSVDEMVSFFDSLRQSLSDSGFASNIPDGLEVIRDASDFLDDINSFFEINQLPSEALCAPREICDADGRFIGYRDRYPLCQACICLGKSKNKQLPFSEIFNLFFEPEVIILNDGVHQQAIPHLDVNVDAVQRIKCRINYTNQISLNSIDFNHEFTVQVRDVSDINQYYRLKLRADDVICHLEEPVKHYITYSRNYNYPGNPIQESWVCHNDGTVRGCNHPDTSPNCRPVLISFRVLEKKLLSSAS